MRYVAETRPVGYNMYPMVPGGHWASFQLHLNYLRTVDEVPANGSPAEVPAPVQTRPRPPHSLSGPLLLYPLFQDSAVTVRGGENGGRGARSKAVRYRWFIQ